MEKTISQRGELIKEDIKSVLITGLFAGVSTIITEVVNLVPTWELDNIQQIALIGILTLLLDLAKKYSKVTQY